MNKKFGAKIINEEVDWQETGETFYLYEIPMGRF
jgi:hypothetical protein